MKLHPSDLKASKLGGGGGIWKLANLIYLMQQQNLSKWNNSMGKITAKWTLSQTLRWLIINFD